MALAMCLGLLALVGAALADRTAITDPQGDVLRSDGHGAGPLDIASATAAHSPTDHSRLVHKVTFYPLSPGPHDFGQDPINYLGYGGNASPYGIVCLQIYRQKPTFDQSIPAAYRIVCTQGLGGREPICAGMAGSDFVPAHCQYYRPPWAWTSIGPDTVRFSFPRRAIGHAGRHRYFWVMRSYYGAYDLCDEGGGYDCDDAGPDWTPDTNGAKHQLTP